MKDDFRYRVVISILDAIIQVMVPVEADHIIGSDHRRFFELSGVHSFEDIQNSANFVFMVVGFFAKADIADIILSGQFQKPFEIRRKKMDMFMGAGAVREPAEESFKI